MRQRRAWRARKDFADVITELPRRHRSSTDYRRDRRPVAATAATAMQMAVPRKAMRRDG